MQPGKIITNKALVRAFSVGNMGGMRRSKKTNALVIVSDKTKGLYEDRWEGNILHYTGMGKTGHQALNGNQNKTLFESRSNGIAVHLFEVLERGKYIYLGEVKLAGDPYQESQPDIRKRRRRVWMFPVALKPDGFRYIPEIGKLRASQEAKERSLMRRSAAALKRLANKRSQSKPKKRMATAEQFVRDPAVSAYVKKEAKGICDLCQELAPFRFRGQPFLHCHHVRWLARGGADIIQNAVAICPNCHERMHRLERNIDVRKLAARTKKRDPELPVYNVFGGR
jgi:5-methylcytosine-specific restriction protein A